MKQARRTKRLTSKKGGNNRPTIGFLTPNILRQNHPLQWLGVVDAAREHDVNLLSFLGEALRSPRGFEAQANVLYGLVSAEGVDGLVIWSGQLEWAIGREEMAAFCRRYRPLPVVSAETAFEGIPSVLVDNYQGMRGAIAHLIEVHGLERIAYIRGPANHWGAQERYRAYIGTLAEYGIPFNPDLVAPPSEWLEGAAMVGVLLDERGLQPQADFEALVAVNDDMAYDALRALQARGIRVPEDVAVVGFDDHMRSRAITPPLTTVRPPFYETGRKAVEMLLALLAGENVPEQVLLPAELVVRQSCGCESVAVVQAAVGPLRADRRRLKTVLSRQRERIIAEMTQAVGGLGESLDFAWAGRLLDSFAADLETPTGAFLRALRESLQEATARGDDVAAMQNAVSVLRRNTLACLDEGARSRAEDLWQQARVVIGETAERHQAYKTLQVEQQAEVLREVGQALATTFDMKGLMDEVADGLSRLGIPGAYLSLYEDPRPYAYLDPAPEWSRLMLAYTEKGRMALPSDGLRFLSRRLLPDNKMWPDRQYCYVVKPLYFREEQIGFALFEVGPHEGRVYETLRAEISSALHGGLLLRAREEAEAALERAYAEVERQVAERTAQLQREIAERERAQEENLRLQQEVIEAQQRAIRELSAPIIPVLEGVIVMPLIGSIDTLRARDVTRALLAGIREHRAKVVILDITGVPIVDSGVAAYLNKTIQAARLKGARTIVTGVSEAVAETIVDLGIDWSGIETLSDLQTGLKTVLAGTGQRAV